MRARVTGVALMVFVFAIAASGCTSDPEGPIAEKFLEDGTYGGEAGETFRYLEVPRCSTITVPRGIGGSTFLKIGELQDIRFEAILLEFDFTFSEDDSGKTVATAIMHLPVQIQSPDTLFSVTFGMHELSSGFEETDTITVVPAFDPLAIPDSLGEAQRTLDIYQKDFSVDRVIVQEWLDGERQHNGLALIWQRDPDTLGIIEMNAHEYGQDPPAFWVTFTDGTADTFAAVKDYSVATFLGDGLDCVGGVATRLYFTFDLAGVADRAMIHSSSLVLSTIGENGLSRTPGEAFLGIDPAFVYYVYTPETGAPGTSDFLEGTGVDEGSFNAVETQTLKLALRGFTADVVSGARENTGLVLQSDLEAIRFQRASFYTSDADSTLRPYIEVIYSMPADFGDK